MLTIVRSTPYNCLVVEVGGVYSLVVMPTCMLKQQLLDQLQTMGKQKAALQKAELNAVLSGKPYPDLRLRMENASEMRKVLMDRLRQHIAEHGC
jgi:hypothetical protein